MNTSENIEIKRLTDEDFNQISRMLECEPAALKAVQQVETGGKGGFFAPGKPAILFEGHIFWKLLKERGFDPEKYLSGNEDILFPKWNRKFYKGGIREYDRLEKARKIHKEAADASASWGMFQIMGFNYAACGEASVESFVQSMCESESKQLLLFANFIKKKGEMQCALQSKDWAAFAKCYNGPGYAENRYDERLEAAYRKFKGGGYIIECYCGRLDRTFRFPCSNKTSFGYNFTVQDINSYPKVGHESNINVKMII